MKLGIQIAAVYGVAVLTAAAPALAIHEFRDSDGLWLGQEYVAGAGDAAVVVRCDEAPCREAACVVGRLTQSGCRAVTDCLPSGSVCEPDPDYWQNSLTIGGAIWDGSLSDRWGDGRYDLPELGGPGAPVDLRARVLNYDSGGRALALLCTDVDGNGLYCESTKGELRQAFCFETVAQVPTTEVFGVGVFVAGPLGTQAENVQQVGPMQFYPDGVVARAEEAALGQISDPNRAIEHVMQELVGDPPPWWPVGTCAHWRNPVGATTGRVFLNFPGG